MNFISFKLEEPVTKQYTQQKIQSMTVMKLDSLTDSINEYLKKETVEKLCNASDIAIYSDDATSTAQKEMMSLFLGYFEEIKKEFMLEYLPLVKVSLTKSDLLLDKITSFKRPEH